MVKKPRRADGLQRRRSCCFGRRRATLFAMARDLSEEFGAHVAVLAVAPTGEFHAFGAPTADSVLRTCIPADEPLPLPAPQSLPRGGGGGADETAGEAAARVARMKRETEETTALVATEWARVAAAWGKVRAVQASAGKRNWWEVDVDALGEEELPVFIRALEMLKTDVQRRVDAMASARPKLLWKEKENQ